ncbi:hypothetical protein ACA910_008443 [Epithemia clementina (nom. ined.)]
MQVLTRAASSSSASGARNNTHDTPQHSQQALPSHNDNASSLQSHFSVNRSLSTAMMHDMDSDNEEEEEDIINDEEDDYEDMTIMMEEEDDYEDSDEEEEEGEDEDDVVIISSTSHSVNNSIQNDVREVSTNNDRISNNTTTTTTSDAAVGATLEHIMGLLLDRAAAASMSRREQPQSQERWEHYHHQHHRENQREGGGAMKCPLCNVVHAPQTGASSHGSRFQVSHQARTAFVRDMTCPICLEVPALQPMVNLACGHVLCQGDFLKLGGSIQILSEPYDQAKEDEAAKRKTHHMNRVRVASTAAVGEDQNKYSSQRGGSRGHADNINNNNNIINTASPSSATARASVPSFDPPTTEAVNSSSSLPSSPSAIRHLRARITFPPSFPNYNNCTNAYS